MIFSDFIPMIEAKLTMERTKEILRKIKKPCLNDANKSAESQDQMIIERTELASDGTTRLYVKDGKEPIRMYPDVKTVWAVACYKRFIPLMANSLRSMGWCKRITTILAIRYNFGIFPKWFNYYFSMNPILLKDEHYSQPVKEVRRVLKGILDDNLIDALALIIEYDSAYRYRFQDIIMELNKDNLNKPAKEIIRLLDIVNERDYQDRFKSYRKLVKPLFFICPKIKRQVVSILKDINIDEVKLSKEDIYWTNIVSTYKYRGLTKEQRKAENIKNYGS